MSAAVLLFLPVAPAPALAFAAGYAPSLLPLLLVLYWGVFPSLLYGAGKVFDRLPVRLPAVRGEVYALALPYLLYWPAARKAGCGLGAAYRAFFRGPGLGVPLAALLGAAFGAHLPPLATSLGVLLLSLALERAVSVLRRAA